MEARNICAPASASSPKIGDSDEDSSDLLGVGEATSEGEAEPLKHLTPEMRPPGDTSRKYIKFVGDRAVAKGGRKTATATVYLWRTPPGELASIMINRKTLPEYFGRNWFLRLAVCAPFRVTNTEGEFNVTASVKGGGLSGQAQAIRHGIATAMQGFDLPLYRPPLKAAGYLKRDPRSKERKKPGQKRARKKYQWVKR